MKLKIKNLFGYRNYDLDFNNKITVLIGENGSGKSTILKIINALLNEDLITLSQIDFEEINIQIDFNDEVKMIEHKNGNFIENKNWNLIINKNEIKPLKYVEDMKFKIILKQFLEQYNFEEDVNKIELNFKKFINEFNSYFEMNKSNVKIKAPININFKEDEKLFFNINQKEFEKNEFFPNGNTEDELREDLISTIYRRIMYNVPFGCEKYFYYLYVTFIRLEIISKYKFPFQKGLKYFLSKDIASKPLLKQIFILSDFIKQSNKYYNEENLPIYYDGFIIKNKKDYHTFMKFDNDAQGIDRERIMMMFDLGYRPLRIFSTIYGKFDNAIDDYVNFKDNREYKVPLSKKETIIKLINHLSSELNNEPLEKDTICLYDKNEYSKDDLIKVLKIFNHLKAHKIIIDDNIKTKEDYDKYLEIYKENKGLKQTLNILKLLEFSREEYIEKICNEIDNVFTYKGDKQEFEYGDKLNNIYTFLPYIFSIEDIFDKAKQINIKEYQDSEEAISFFEFASKYFKNKEISLYYDELGNIRFDILDCCNNISLDESQISSGENKLLRLIKSVTLVEKDIILMDEPELSLSLYWQNTLIDDLIKYSNASYIIIATQSANLINENQIQYLEEVTWK